MNLLTSPLDAATVEPLGVAWEDGAYVVCRGRRQTEDGIFIPVLIVRPAQLHPRVEIVDRLAHEYALADTLNCTSAVRPVELLQEHGQTLLVLEHCEGEPLEAFPMPFDSIVFLRFAITIASALGKIHARGLIHRDINPTHILVNGTSGAARLTGFGIASLAQRERQAPEPPELIAGTLAYMAPEQTGRMNRSIDLRSDLYSLGVVFYRMLTGRLPFSATDPMELVHCHIARQPPAPLEWMPTLAPAISAIVMKLLAKTAEDRYQSAAGVAHDLRRCLAQWDSKGLISDFPLAQSDVSDRLLIPEKLYGRNVELSRLLAAFDRVTRGEPGGLVLIAGYSGIGKSAVANELQKALLPRGGLFLAGKFDQFKRDIPYSTLANAFQAGVRLLLTRSEIDLAPWREAFHEALGPNGLLIVDLVPELAMMLGDQPPVPALPPQDAQRRFHLVLRRFIAVFARAEHPLTLFLDDLQWLDTATLDFLEDLFVHGDLRHLLVIGAYRNNEVDTAHPLYGTLGSIRASGVPMQEIVLEPLASEHLERLVTDALQCAPTRAVPLTRILHQKTGGNPFFALQFLSSLVDEGLLSFDHAAGRWSWDVNRIHAKGYTENVIELVIGKLSRLPLVTQLVLQRFACIGNSSTPRLLEMICEQPWESVRDALSHAVRAGLVLSTDSAYRFLHDRVQEAAYTLIAEGDRADMHLQMARLLLKKTPLEHREESVFDIVSQFNRAAHLVITRAERDQVAALNLLAGKRAKASTAYASALTYLAVGRSLLSDDDWTRNYELIFSLEYLLAECEVLSARMQSAEGRLSELDQRARTNHHIALVTRLRITLYTTLDQSQRSVEICLDYLRRSGTQWSAHPDRQAVHNEYHRIGSLLGKRQIEDLIDLPLMSDPNVLDTLDVLTEIVTPAFFTDQNLCALVLCRMVNLSLEYGNCDASCYAYVWFATYAGPVFAQYEMGYRFGRLGYGLVEHGGLTRFKARTYTSFGNIVVPWSRHVLEGREPIRRAFDIANACGDLTYTLYTCCDLIQNFFSVGDSLGDVQIEVDKAVAISDRIGFGLVSDMLGTYRGLVRTLLGLTPRFGSFDDDQFNEHAFESHLASSSTLALPEFDYWVRKLQARYLAEEFAEALDAKARAERVLWVATSQFETAEFHFYGALSHAACWHDANEAGRLFHANALIAHREQLEIWASHCPENFVNRAALVSAEISRIEGNIVEAERLYELAVQSARANGFVHNEAIACEVASRFYASRRLTEIADMYLRNARHAYVRWGAKGKLRHMDDRHRQLSQQSDNQAAASGIEASVEHLDLATVLKVSQAISREIVLDKLIHTLMRTAIEHAGAERGLLIATKETTLRIEAEAVTADGVITVNLERTPLRPDNLALSVIHYSLRTGENVILNDASRQPEFGTDDYLRRSRTNSVACMPLLHQGKPIALLYLENSLASHVFTESRVAVLKLLASQAAIALENSYLYRDLAEREARIRRLVDANIVGVFIWDMQGPIYEANDAFLRMIGYSREDLAAGRVNCMEITPVEWHDQDLHAIADLRRNGTLQGLEKEYIRADGSRVAVLLGAATFGSTGDQMVAFVVDLSERKQAEATARESERRIHEIEIELTHANRIATLGQLTASISHEIRQPVASAVFNAQAATHWLDAQPPNFDEVRAALARVVKNGMRANDVIRRIRALVKKTPAQRERLVINDVIREVVELGRGEASKHHVSINVDLATGLPHVEGDRVQLQQVIMNLMVNAIEAMSGNSADTRTLTIVTCSAADDHLRIAVKDTGPGIEADNVEHLFEPFFTTKTTGMGMGLSICHSIVEAHGSTLRVFANEPQGAIFQFDLATATNP
ncbi:ATP-binding sensor histidine kinase [Paraburkholderia sp. BCC1884]|uniref:trifunctional serine/threonine-protein kinase/ATP-binding protein/sensor histidine kinase n=1 Tax=Paraburkholderia sp. BCC1884 TaxID=2562668 RepID=UPI0021B37A79|nr:ATP-binding sensor histidine kinase [Paraburkholderia sp. BCC1884]